MKWMGKLNFITVTIAMLATTSTYAADDFDFYGYFRTGLVTGADGSMSNNLGYTFEKKRLGRLGNEFDTYAEVGLGKEIYDHERQSIYVDTMIKMWDGDTDSMNNDSPFGWEGLNMQFRNYMDNGETIWLGIRKYKRSHIVMNDYMYWNETNLGTGIENFQLGVGKLSAAILHRDMTGSTIKVVDESCEGSKVCNTINAKNFELTYEGIPIWNGGSVWFGYKYLNANPSSDQIDDVDNGEHDYVDGQVFLAELNQSFSYGTNITTIQYYLDGSAMQGYKVSSADTLNGEIKSGDGFAIRNYGTVALNNNFDLSHAIIYAEANDISMWNGNTLSAETFSVSAKLTYHWSDITRTYLEAGYFEDNEIENNSSENRNGNKYTIVQALSFGRNQPELRFYASYFDSDNSDWNDGEHAFEGQTTDNTWAIGAQLNVWW